MDITQNPSRPLFLWSVNFALHFELSAMTVLLWANNSEGKRETWALRCFSHAAFSAAERKKCTPDSDCCLYMYNNVGKFLSLF